jgi:hypothetical protein
MSINETPIIREKTLEHQTQLLHTFTLSWPNFMLRRPLDFRRLSKRYLKPRQILKPRRVLTNRDRRNIYLLKQNNPDLKQVQIASMSDEITRRIPY